MYSSNRLLGPLADTQPTHIYVVGVLRSGSGSESGAVRRRTGKPSTEVPHREWFLAHREKELEKPLVGGSGCRRSRFFTFATETTVVRGSIRVGAFKKHFEAPGLNMKRSSPHTAVRSRSCVEAPAISCSQRPGRRSYRRSNFPTAPSSAIPGRFCLGCASGRSEGKR
jgi:hypothetical protein